MAMGGIIGLLCRPLTMLATSGGRSWMKASWGWWPSCPWSGTSSWSTSRRYTSALLPLRKLSGVLMNTRHAAGGSASFHQLRGCHWHFAGAWLVLMFPATQVVREADGYQAHLVSPEFGLRRLVDETIGLVLEPVNVCVRRVHQVLLDAARRAYAPLCLTTLHCRHDAASGTPHIQRLHPCMQACRT